MKRSLLFIPVFLLLFLGCNTTTEVSNDNQSTSSTQESSSSSEVSISSEEGRQLSDPEDAPLLSDYSFNPQQIGDSAVSDIQISSLETFQYTTFLRVVFTLGNDKTPFTSVKLLTQSNEINVEIQNVSEDNSGIQFENSKTIYNSVVTSIFHSVVADDNTAAYKIGIAQSTPFYLHIVDGEKDKIILDVKEVEGAQGGEAPGIENQFTTTDQELVSTAKENTINISGYSYSNQTDIFRIVWNVQGTEGTPIPNVSVEPYEKNGDRFLKVTINNLANDYIAKNGLQSDLPDQTVTALTGTFLNNSSTYTISLSKSTEYKIYSNLAPSQLILDVKR